MLTPPKKLSLPLFVAFTIFLTSGCKQMQDKLDAYLTAAQQSWGFQGSALVAVDGQVLLAKGYGMANVAFQEPNTPDTKFFIGSITKQFTATAILQLQEQGRLSVSDPISTYLPDYPEPAGDKITIHHLLTHTSGVPNYTDLPEVLLRRTTRISPSEIMETFQNEPLEFEPGSDFHYSNSGYIILGAIIEAVSGQSYEAYLHRSIFKPLGMDNSGYARREMGIPNRAEGYTTDEDLAVADALPMEMSVLHTAGALYSTVNDMLKWDRALYNNRVLTDESLEAMFTRYAGNYGYGWFIDSLYGYRHYFHGGFLDGYNTTFDHWPDMHLCVVVFSNEDEAPVKKIARGLAAIVLQKPHVSPERKTPKAIDPATLADYEGVYDLGNGRYRFVTVDNNVLHTNIVGEPPSHLLPEARDLFFLEPDNTVTMQFVRNDSGRVTSLIYRNDLGAWSSTRLTDDEAASIRRLRTAIPPDPAIHYQYTGTYALESMSGTPDTNLVLVISRRGDHFFASAPGVDEVEIFPLSDTEFFHKHADFGISFTLDGAGNAIGCILKMGNARVHGVKIK